MLSWPLLPFLMDTMCPDELLPFQLNCIVYLPPTCSVLSSHETARLGVVTASDLDGTIYLGGLPVAGSIHALLVCRERVLSFDPGVLDLALTLYPRRRASYATTQVWQFVVYPPPLEKFGFARP